MTLGSQSRSVLAVDDDRAFRLLLGTVLTEAGYAVRQAASGEEALREARSERPLAVILDVCLPGLSGYEVCRTLREEHGSDLPILFVSGERTDSLDRASGLLVGADDYLVKPFAADELIARVRGATRRPQRPAPVDGRHLTAREREVLRLLAAGLEQQEIAERLVIAPKTVGGHIERILDKLGVHSRAQAVAVAYRDALV